jgi:hypothetical protein
MEETIFTHGYVIVAYMFVVENFIFLLFCIFCEVTDHNFASCHIFQMVYMTHSFDASTFWKSALIRLTLVSFVLQIKVLNYLEKNYCS